MNLITQNFTQNYFTCESWRKQTNNRVREQDGWGGVGWGLVLWPLARTQRPAQWPQYDQVVLMFLVPFLTYCYCMLPSY